VLSPSVIPAHPISHAPQKGMRRGIDEPETQKKRKTQHHHKTHRSVGGQHKRKDGSAPASSHQDATELAAEPTGLTDDKVKTDVDRGTPPRREGLLTERQNGRSRKTHEV